MPMVRVSNGGSAEIRFWTDFRLNLITNYYSMTINNVSDFNEIAFACKCGHASGFDTHSVSGATVLTDSSSGLYIYLIMIPTSNTITISGHKNNTATNEFTVCVVS